jgi:hypothetical protein
MKLYLETVPFNSARLPRWLEQHLVGDHLGELIEELLAVRRPPEGLDFDAWFLPWKEQILSKGLAQVPRAVLRQLMADPPALRKLQREVLLGGGRYWDQVPRSKGFRRRLAVTRPSFAPPATPARTPPPTRHAPRPTPADDTPIPLSEAPPDPPARRGLPGWAVIATVIATVVVSGLVVAAVLVMSNPPG